MEQDDQPVILRDADLLSPKALSEYLGVPLGTVYGWRYKGTGPRACRVGRHLRYRFGDVQDWLVEQQGAAAR